jgi:hypothetical protein
MKHSTLSSNAIWSMITVVCALHIEYTHADVPDTLGVRHFRDSNDDNKTPMMFNCSQLSNTHVVSKIGSGITKTAFRIQLGDETFIAKRVSAESPDKRTRMGVYKLLKEAHILHTLHGENQNAMRVRGVCIFSEDADMYDFQNGVTVLYETQSQHERISFNFKHWIDFLKRLHLSSLGSIVITDTKRDQFTMMRGQINMHDMDDVFIQATRNEKSVRANCNQIVDRLGVVIDVQECINMVMTP